MRLKQILDTLERYNDKLSFSAQQVSGNPGLYRISNFRQAIAAAVAIGNTGALAEDVKQVLIVRDISQSAHAEISVAVAEYQAFTAAVQQLRLKADALRDAVRSLFIERAEFTVDILLPPNLDLKGLEDTTDDLRKLLTQALVNDYIGATVSLSEF